MRLILAAALALTALPAFAEDTPEEIALEARKGYMQMLGTNFGQLVGMAKGDIAYDEAAAGKSAANIQALSNYDVSIHFLPNTAAGQMDDSEASPKIWEDMAGFQAKYADFQKAAATLPEGVKGGQANVGAAVQQVGGTCKGCHDTYRKE